MGLTGIPRVSRKNGYRCCGNTEGMELKLVQVPAGMDFIIAGNLRGV